MRIGLVTVTYNSADVLPDFLDSVCKQSFKDFQLFVIDNHSTDLTIEVFNQRKQSNFELIINKENVGVAAANNQGIKKALHSACEYILLINNDTIFEANLLEKLMDASQKYSSSIVAPKSCTTLKRIAFGLQAVFLIEKKHGLTIIVGKMN